MTPAGNRLALLSLTILVGGAGACGPSKVEAEREAILSHRADTDKLFATLQALAARPFAPVQVSKIDYSGPTLSADSRTGNLVVLPAEPAILNPLLAGTYIGDAMFFDNDFRDLADLTAEAKSKRGPSGTRNAKGIDLTFGKVATIHYVLFVKTITQDQPVIQSGVFKPGHIVADARLFDLDGKDYGGVHFEASNSDKVSYQQAQTSNDAAAQVERDLEDHARLALHAAVAAQLPGMTIPSL